MSNLFTYKGKCRNAFPLRFIALLTNDFLINDLLSKNLLIIYLQIPPSPA